MKLLLIQFRLLLLVLLSLIFHLLQVISVLGIAQLRIRRLIDGRYDYFIVCFLSSFSLFF